MVSSDLSSRSDAIARPSLFRSAPLHLKASLAWMLGLFAGYLFNISVTPVFGAILILVFSSVKLFKSPTAPWRLTALMVAVGLAGMCRWELWQNTQESPYASSILQLEGSFHGTVHSVPVVYRRPDSPWNVSYGSSELTTFEFQVRLSESSAGREKFEVWQVSIDGNARGLLSCGDTVTIQGQAVRPKSASNPGQFDFREMMASRGVTRLLFANHFSSVQVIQQADWWNPFRWASWLRADAERILDTSLNGQNQQLAIAMFLGNRSQLPYELRDAFVASGTMHLLAISGLHVGILSLFVIRLFHLLGASRGRSLLAMMIVICGYAMITGFRPSVVRATLFLLLFGSSELLGRKQSLLDLLSLTALVMTMWAPGLLVDTGAWLSFLSVGALAWYAKHVSQVSVNQDAPEDQRSISQFAVYGFQAVKQMTFQRYGQMLSILLFTLPLTTSVFHVLSIVSLLVNVLLIVYAFFVLAAGYVTLLVGVLLPALCWVPATVFSLFLDLFSLLVNWASDLSYGHFYLADFPAWFLPLWYGALVAMVISRATRIRRAFAVLLFVFAIAGIGTALKQPTDVELTVTVLDIGHGSAAVVESGDQVILVDSGSLNQGRRAAEIVSEFLWTRGWNHIDHVVISHADSDHYNAVPTLISRFPIGQIVTSRQFIRSTDEAVQALMQLIRQKQIPVQTIETDFKLLLESASLSILQVDPSLLPDNASDNETSLVVKVTRDDVNVLLPGDLEQRGLEQLLPKLGQSDVLVSPHHGSRLSNPTELATSISPALVVVSARDTSSRRHLENVFCESRAVWWTSETGAVQLVFQKEHVKAHAFRPGDHIQPMVILPRD